MNKDKEAFEKWYKINFSELVKETGIAKMENDFIKAWQAACEYKQSQVNEIELKEIKINRAFVELAAKFVKLQEELLLAREAASSEAAFVNELRAENIKLKEALIACPILGEIYSDSNDRFKEWNFRHEYILKKLWDER